MLYFPEDKGDGKWVVQIRKQETDYSVDGEYVAVAKNKGGMSKVTFQIQHGGMGVEMPTTIAKNQEPVAVENLAVPSNDYAKSASPQPRPVSVCNFWLLNN